MTTMNDLVTQTLARLSGGAPGVLTTLANDYLPGDTTVTLSPGQPGMNPGQLLSVGLNTLYVLSVDPTGATLDVLPIGQYGQVQANAGDLVRCRPQHTNADVFERLSAEIVSLSSPMNGLYGPAVSETGVNWTDGTYFVPELWTVDPIRVLGVKYLTWGSTIWRDVNGWEWQPERGCVLVHAPINGSLVQVIYALPFARPNDLTDDLADLGMPTPTHDIPILGVCGYLSLGAESRRNRLTSQGDPRLAAEVPMTAGSSMAREYMRQRDVRITEEAARLGRLYGYRMQDLGQPEGSYGY